MARTELTALPPTSRIWLFGISPSLDEGQSSAMLARVDAFLNDWNAHGTPVTAARALIEGSFLVIAVDHASETSGCSIDRMFGLFREFERELGVSMLDSNRVFVRHADGRVEALTRSEFRDKGDQHTIVYDTTAERLDEILTGHWIRKAEEAWPGKLLPDPA
jgi:hypothetical protein